jgi:hypothetical protein
MSTIRRRATLTSVAVTAARNPRSVLMTGFGVIKPTVRSLTTPATLRAFAVRAATD